MKNCFDTNADDLTRGFSNESNVYTNGCYLIFLFGECVYVNYDGLHTAEGHSRMPFLNVINDMPFVQQSVNRSQNLQRVYTFEHRLDCDNIFSVVFISTSIFVAWYACAVPI